MDPLAGSRWSAPGTVEGFTRSPPNPVLMRFVEQELERAPRARVLDLGCGAGRNAVPMARAGCRVLGTDLSWPMLQAAAHRAQGRGGGRANRLGSCTHGAPSCTRPKLRPDRGPRDLEPRPFRRAVPERFGRGGAGGPTGRGPLRVHLLPPYAGPRRRPRGRRVLRLHAVRGRASVLSHRARARRRVGLGGIRRSRTPHRVQPADPGPAQPGRARDLRGNVPPPRRTGFDRGDA